MALAIHTDIYKDARRLLTSMADPLVNMPRNARAVFGLPLRDLLIDNLEIITEANRAREANKVPHYDTLLRNVRRQEVLIRLFHEKRWISDGQYGLACQYVVGVAKQANGLRKNYVKSPAI